MSKRIISQESDSDQYIEEFWSFPSLIAQHPVVKIQAFNFLFTYAKAESNGITKEDIAKFLAKNPLFENHIEEIFVAEEKYTNIQDTHIHVYLQLDHEINIRKKKFFEELIVPAKNGTELFCHYKKIDNRNPKSKNNILAYLQKEDKDPFTNIQHLPPKKILPPHLMKIQQVTVQK